MGLRAEHKGSARAVHGRIAEGTVAIHEDELGADAVDNPEVRVEVGRPRRIAVHLDDQPVASRSGEAKGVDVSGCGDGAGDHRADGDGVSRWHRFVGLDLRYRCPGSAIQEERVWNDDEGRTKRGDLQEVGPGRGDRSSRNRGRERSLVAAIVIELDGGAPRVEQGDLAVGAGRGSIGEEVDPDLVSSGGSEPEEVSIQGRAETANQFHPGGAEEHIRCSQGVVRLRFTQEARRGRRTRTCRGTRTGRSASAG